MTTSTWLLSALAAATVAACGNSGAPLGPDAQGDDTHDAADCGPTGTCPMHDGGGSDSSGMHDGGGSGDGGGMHDGGSDGGGTQDGGGTHDGSSDGGSSTGDGGGTSDGGSSTGDGGTSTTCSAPADPTQTYALSGTAAFADTRWPRVATVGGSIFAIGPFSNDTGWYKWAGGGWSFITPPWPSGPKPFIIDIYDLPTGHILFQVQLTYAPNNYEYALIDFDGTTMSAPVIIPAALRGFVRKATRTPDGTYYILTSSVPNDPPWATRAFNGTSWSAASPAPIPQNTTPQSVAFTALSNGRMTLLYTNGHLHELHRMPTEPWSTDVDLTPQWAVAASEPIAVGARAGGIAVAVTGVSNSYRFPYYWDSVDGITYSAGEYTSPATQLQDQTKFLAVDCIAQPVLVIRRQNSIMLLKRGAPANWQPLATGASYYSAGGTAAILPDGKTYFGWSYTLSNGDHFTNLLASP